MKDAADSEKKYQKWHKWDKKHKAKNAVYHGPLGFAFFAAYIGALVYFVERNDGFWGFLLAFLQAALWPAYVLFHVLGNLHV